MRPPVINPAAHVQTVSPYLHLSDEMVEARIKEIHRGIIDNYMEMAALLAEWKRRKRDVGAFRLAGVGDWLLAVGEQRLVPEVFDRFWPDVDMMAFFMRLSVVDQKDYLDGKTITVATGPHGEQQLEMTIETIVSTDKKVAGLRYQVFDRRRGGARIRSFAEQRSLILEREKAASEPKPETIAGVEIDHDRQGIQTKRSQFISKEDLSRMLKVLS